MKRTRALMVAALLAAGSLSAASAWADRGYRGPYMPPPAHHHHADRALGWGIAGLAIGSAILWSATRPTVVVQEPAPAVVVSTPVYTAPPPAYQPVLVAAPPADGWWYYCRPAGAYYPYVDRCPRAWERVSPRAGW